MTTPNPGQQPDPAATVELSYSEYQQLVSLEGNELRRLRAEVERLTAERDMLERFARDVVVGLEAKLAQAEAEIARLRDALQRIRGMAAETPEDRAHHTWQEEAQRIVADALRPPSQEPPR